MAGAVMIMRVIVRMVMVMTVAVVVVVVVDMVMARVVPNGEEGLVIIVVGLEELLHGYLPIDGLSVREDVLDRLVLEDWSTQLEQCRGILLVVLIDMLLLAWIAPRLLDKRAAQLVLGHLDL